MRDEPLVEASRRAIQILEQALREHELAAHDGGFCVSERANTVAHLAHRLGVNDELTLEIFAEQLLYYEVRHQQRQHTNGHHD